MMKILGIYKKMTEEQKLAKTPQILVRTALFLAMIGFLALSFLR